MHPIYYASFYFLKYKLSVDQWSRYIKIYSTWLPAHPFAQCTRVSASTFSASDVFYKVNLWELISGPCCPLLFISPWGFDVGMETEELNSPLPFFIFLPCVSDHSWCAEAIFPANQELDSSFPKARTRNCHASALPCHRSETGTNTHRGTDAQ